MFGVQGRFRSDAVELQGLVSEYVRVGDDRVSATFNFCPSCGATVYYMFEGVEDSLAIPVGSFADPSFPAPTFSVDEERMHEWVGLPDNMEHLA